MAFTLNDLTTLLEHSLNAGALPTYLGAATLLLGLCAVPVLGVVTARRERPISAMWWLVAPCALILVGLYGELTSLQQMSQKLAAASAETQLKHTLRGVGASINHRLLCGLGLSTLAAVSALALALAHALRASSPRRIFKARGALAVGTGLFAAGSVCASLVAFGAYRPASLMAASVGYIGVCTLALVLVRALGSQDEARHPGEAATACGALFLSMAGVWGVAQSARAIGVLGAMDAYERATPESREALTRKALELANLDTAGVLVGLGVFALVGGVALCAPSMLQAARDARALRGVLALIALALFTLVVGALLHLGALSTVSTLEPLLVDLAIGR